MQTKERLARIGLPVIAVMASIGVGFAGVTSAQTASATDAPTTRVERGMRAMSGMRGNMPVVMGKVTAISGTTITVQDQKPGETSNTIYTVDASAAKILKHAEGTTPVESSISAILVGDTVAVRGTVSGTSVSATEIMDGVMMKGMHGGKGFGGRGSGTHGTVSAVSGSTITLTGTDGKSYTVDATSAQINKILSIKVSDVQVGDILNVHGDVSGTNVTAKHIMDGVPQK